MHFSFVFLCTPGPGCRQGCQAHPGEVSLTVCLARNAGGSAGGLARNPNCVRLPAFICKSRAQRVQTDVQSSHAYLNVNYSDDYPSPDR